MIKWLLHAFAGFCIVQHYLACTYQSLGIQLPEYCCARPVRRCTYAVTAYQPICYVKPKSFNQILNKIILLIVGKAGVHIVGVDKSGLARGGWRLGLCLARGGWCLFFEV